ncbi:hypothetical protein ACWJKU_01340 [Methylocaldum sp. MU1018]
MKVNPNAITEANRRLAILVALSLATKYKLTVRDARTVVDGCGYPASLATPRRGSNIRDFGNTRRSSRGLLGPRCPPGFGKGVDNRTQCGTTALLEKKMQSSANTLSS